MRRIIELKHRVCDFNCMLSGLEDMVEQERHFRLPEYLLFIGGYIGFRYDIDPTGKLPCKAEPGYGVGRTHYRFLSDILEFDWHVSEGCSFQEAWKNMKSLIDSGKPVIAGELDMFHLPYLKKFYHRIHVPFHYITLVGYDEEKSTVIIQDCGRPMEEELPLSDFSKALNQEVPGLCKRNAHFWFDFHPVEKQSDDKIIRKIFQKSGKNFLSDGLNGLKRFIPDFPDWPRNLTMNQLHKCLMHLVTYTCSNTPMPPQKLVFFPLEEIFKKHHGMRDRFAVLLDSIRVQWNIWECGAAADCFRKSGNLFQEITDRISDYLASAVKTKSLKQGLGQAALLFEKLMDYETEGFTILSKITF